MPDTEILRRLDEQDERIEQVGKCVVHVSNGLDANTKITEQAMKDLKQIHENTRELVRFFETLENGALVMCRIAKAVDWTIEKTLKVWKPTVVLFAMVYWVMFQKLPDWMTKALASLFA